jgi:hypothetical protein
MQDADPLVCRFTSEQRSDLKRLRLIDTQVTALERVLPGCRILISRGASLQGVRDKMKRLLDTFGDSILEIERLSKPTTPDLIEVINRIQEASYEAGGHSGETNRAMVCALDALRTLKLATMMPTRGRYG